MTRLAVMLRCLRDGRLLARHLDGELDRPDLAARVDRHIGECRRCGLHARTLTDLRRALRSGRADDDRITIRRLERFHRSLRDERPDR